MAAGGNGAYPMATPSVEPATLTPMAAKSVSGNGSRHLDIIKRHSLPGVMAVAGVLSLRRWWTFTKSLVPQASCSFI